MALPALERAAEVAGAADRRPPVVQVVDPLAPLLELAGLEARLLRLGSRRRVFRAAGRLRDADPEHGVLLTPSFSAALIFLLAGVPVRRGVRTDGRGWLLTDPVDREPLLEGHRVAEYLHLVDPSWRGPEAEDGGAAGPDEGPGDERTPGSAFRVRPSLSYPGAGELPRPRLRDPGRARDAWRELCDRRGLEAGEVPTVALCPGGNAPSRRWPAARFAELARRLSGQGTRVLVLGGPADRERTGRVAGAGERAVDLGGATTLPGLAGAMLASQAVVSNDTGPAHLAAALGRPLLVLWGAGDPRQTRPLGEAVRLAGHFGLPCVPCVENRCPRRGEGYVLEAARRECMELIEVDPVARALDEVRGG